MLLEIKAIRYKMEPLNNSLRTTFNQTGGTLGRSSDNHLVLADAEKVVSGTHATIRYENNCFYYIDCSTNGTEIVDRSNRSRLIHHRKVRLNDQDELYIGDYVLASAFVNENEELAPSINEDENEKLAPSDALPENGLDEMIFPPLESDEGDGTHPGRENNTKHIDLSSPFDDKWLNGSYSPGPFNSDSSAPAIVCPPDYSKKPDYSEKINSDPPVSGESLKTKKILPDNIAFEDFFMPSDQVQPPGPETGLKSCESAADLSDLESSELETDLSGGKENLDVIEPIEKGCVSEQWLNSFFHGLGCETMPEISAKEMPQIMRRLGGVFRELLDGFMTILQGREELKYQCGLERTALKAAQNNPLKFSETVDLAIATILKKSNPGYLDAEDAVRQGYEDVRQHQLAMQVGVKASVMEILKRFDPQCFTKSLEEKFVIQKNARCWEAYRTAYPDIFERALEDIYGVEFIRAYEEKIAELTLSCSEGKFSKETE